MVRFQNGRFYTHGVSFAIPEGYFLETEPEFVHEYGLGAWTPDKTCFVEWDVEENCLGTKRELSDLFQESSGVRKMSEIQSVSINGLLGHQADYQREQKYFFELRLSLKENSEFVFLASGTKENMLSWKKSSDLAQVLNNINPE